MVAQEAVLERSGGAPCLPGTPCAERPLGSGPPAPPPGRASPVTRAPRLWAPHPAPAPGQSLTCDEGPRCGQVHDGVVAYRPHLRREHEVVQPTSLPHLPLDPGARAAALPGSVPKPQRVPDGPQQHRSLELLHICPRLRAAAVLLCLQAAPLTSGPLIAPLSGACPSGRHSSSVSAGGTNENTVWTAAHSLP